MSATMWFGAQTVQQNVAELGVTAIVFPAPGPWDREAFRYLDESVIRVFEGDPS